MLVTSCGCTCACVHVCCTGMWCSACGQAPLLVSCCACFVAGALRGSHAEGQQPPNPCGQEHLTRDFCHAPCTCDHTRIVAEGVSGAQSLHAHAIHDVTCLSVCCLFVFVFLLFISFFYLLNTCYGTTALHMRAVLHSKQLR